MDHFLLPYLAATDESEREIHLNDLLVIHAAPLVRRAMRRRLAFYVDQRGINPHNQDAEDLYQDVMTKIVQALLDLRNIPAKTDIENFKQYVARIASNACNDVLRSKSPARARLKNNLRFLLTHHRDFAVWKTDSVLLAGFAGWRDSSRSTSSERQAIDSEERVADFRSSRFPKANIKEVSLAKLVAELFEWVDSPIELDALVNTVAMLLDVRDDPIQSVDDDPDAVVEARIADSTLRARSRLEEQALLRSLLQALAELSPEQRDVFCFGFEDDSGRDLFTVMLEAEVTSLVELAEGLGRPMEVIVELWSRMPMDDEAIATELQTKRPQVYKWRFRALQRLKKTLLPSLPEK